MATPSASGFRSERCPASSRNGVRLQIGGVSGFRLEYVSGFVGMPEASNWSRVTDRHPNLARDQFEAGLNEDA